MVTQSFRALESTGSQTRKDEIVVAAVSAFAGRSRPTRLDANQLVDLVLPTLPHTNSATRRMASACLSDLPHAPHALVMRLCEENVDVCAPLLLRSPVLQDADLIGLIEKNGVAFARVIARRRILTIKVQGLLLALGDATIATIVTADKDAAEPMHPQIKADPAELSGRLEAARAALRNMMREASDEAVAEPGETASAAFLAVSSKQETREPGQIGAKLRRTALFPDDKFFVTALADLHGLTFERAKRILQRAAPSELLTALHAAAVPAGDAFVIAVAFFPALARDKQEIALFLTRYESMKREHSTGSVRLWKAEDISSELRSKPANQPALPQRGLKAS